MYGYGVPVRFCLKIFTQAYYLIVKASQCRNRLRLYPGKGQWGTGIRGLMRGMATKVTKSY